MVLHLFLLVLSESLKLIHVVVTVNLYTTWIVKMAVTLNL